MTVRTRPAPPSHLSEQARAALAMEFDMPTPALALGDVDGWLAHIKLVDGFLAERFPGIDLQVTSSEAQVAGVRTYVVRANDVAPDAPVYLDIHGGALLFGGGELARSMAMHGAKTSGLVHWGVDYRMPPLHPYPAALDDCLGVYRALVDERDVRDVFVGGGSAGGNLAAALMLRIKEEGLPMPAGLILASPELDLTESGDSFAVLDGIDNVLGSLMVANELYANGRDLADPLLSPLFGDVTGFPPTWLAAGTRDLFLSNAVRMHRKLRAAHVKAELHVWEAMPHGGFMGAPEDDEMAFEMRRFLDRHRRDLV